MSQPRKETITIHILSNIKGNQTLKFDQLIEYKMTNIFLGKSCSKYGDETIFRPSSKRSKLSISLDQQSKVLYILFLLHYQLEGCRNILKLRWRQLAFISYKTFWKCKKRSGTSPLASFSAWLLKKNISYVIFY